MVDLFITPSIIQQFYLNPEWGVRAYYNTLYPSKKKKDNYYTYVGKKLHEELGFNNKQRFYKTKVIEIDGQLYELAVEGTPDYVDNEIKELKTTSAEKIKDRDSLDKIINAAKLQLLGYLFLTDTDYGIIVVADRQQDLEFVEVVVQRDDEEFFKWVAKFFKYLWSQQTLFDFVD